MMKKIIQNFIKKLPVIRGFVNESNKIKNQLIRQNNEIQQLKKDTVYYYKNLPVSEYEKELEYWYFIRTGMILNLENPQTYNEKVQWLKLYDNMPVKTQLADKYLVREWVKERIGGQYLIPLIGVWKHFEEIDFEKLPRQFVLKANHGCNWNIIVKNKDLFDREDAKRKFEMWLNRNFAFENGFELQYNWIEPRIIAEQYLESEGDLPDYKFLCFNGKAEYIWVDSDRFTNHKRDILDLQWNRQPFIIKYPNSGKTIPKPENLKKMIETAETLAKGFTHVRIDFYYLNNLIYFGEMTFTPESGTCRWDPPEYDKILGDKIKLPKRKVKISDDRKPSYIRNNPGI